MINNLKQKTDALRQKHILDAAIRVFAAQGFKRATIRNIAQEAGVSDGTIYNVFENKEALLFGVMDVLLQGTKPAAPPDAKNTGDGILDLQEAISSRWDQMTPETLSMLRIIWAEALTDRKLAKRYLKVIVAPAHEALGGLFANNENQKDVAVLRRIPVALFLGLALMKLFGDDVLNDSKSDISNVLAQVLSKGLQLDRSKNG